MRIALFGGTFDPPHRGHIAIAKAAARAFLLDEILFAPTGRQPLKVDASPSSFADRLALTEAACNDAFPDDATIASFDPAQSPQPSLPRFRVTDLDAPRPDQRPNYTVDTLETLKQQHPDDTLFNLVGADSFLDLPRWRSPTRLLALAEWIVVTRPGYPLAPDQISALHLNPQQQARVHLLAGVAENVSATTLRARLHTGDPCADLLSPSVMHYIAEHHLYPTRQSLA
jgi:nicotinate-nucleotide adenylyltransferase